VLRRTSIGVGCVALAAALACNGNNSPTTATSPSPSPSGGTTTSGPVTATVTPDTATAVRSTDPNYTWQGAFTVTLNETAGIVNTVKTLSASLQQSAGGIIIIPPTGLAESYRFDTRAGSPTVPANGNLPIDFVFYYTLPNGGREATITITFSTVDANGGSNTVVAELRSL
jgi:hypothetical protein